MQPGHGQARLVLPRDVLVGMNSPLRNTLGGLSHLRRRYRSHVRDISSFYQACLEHNFYTAIKPRERGQFGASESIAVAVRLLVRSQGLRVFLESPLLSHTFRGLCGTVDSRLENGECLKTKRTRPSSPTARYSIRLCNKATTTSNRHSDRSGYTESVVYRTGVKPQRES